MIETESDLSIRELFDINQKESVVIGKRADMLSDLLDNEFERRGIPATVYAFDFLRDNVDIRLMIHLTTPFESTEALKLAIQLCRKIISPKIDISPSQNALAKDVRLWLDHYR